MLSKQESLKEQFKDQAPNLEKAKSEGFVQSHGESSWLGNSGPTKHRLSAALSWQCGHFQPSLPRTSLHILQCSGVMQCSPAILWIRVAARTAVAAVGGDLPSVQKAHPFPETTALHIASILPI